MKLSKAQIRQAQATRRKTLFPLTPQEIQKHQAMLAYDLHRNIGLSIYACRQVLKCPPDRVRSLVAKAERIKEKLARSCTCPASYDHTPFGHLPNCPTRSHPCNPWLKIPCLKNAPNPEP